MDLPDPDWYLDNVVLPREAGGPVGQRQLTWVQHARRLSASSDPALSYAAGHGFVLTNTVARELGYSPQQIKTRLSNGSWRRPRRGVYAVIGGGDDAMRAALDAAAAVTVRRDHVISHCSATAAHGLPLLDIPTRPQLTARGSCVRPDVDVHAAALPEGDLTEWFGVPITAVARTVVDLARADRRQGLVAADAALHERLCDRPQLAAYAQWPGLRAAREIIALADGRAESPLESLTRLLIHDGGLPAPTPQVWLTDDIRVDLYWPDQRVVLEVDGRSKYANGNPDQVLWREKRRQIRLERLGYRVLRVIWSDVVDHPAETLAYLAAELDRPRL